MIWQISMPNTNAWFAFDETWAKQATQSPCVYFSTRGAGDATKVRKHVSNVMNTKKYATSASDAAVARKQQPKRKDRNGIYSKTCVACVALGGSLKPGVRHRNAIAMNP